MPIRKLCHFTVRRFFGTGKTPSGGFTRADGRVRDRGQPGARARIHERVHADALAWFSNLDAIANPPNGTWFQPSPARYSRIDKSVDCQTAKILPSSTPRDTLTTSVSRASRAYHSRRPPGNGDGGFVGTAVPREGPGARGASTARVVVGAALAPGARRRRETPVTGGEKRRKRRRGVPGQDASARDARVGGLHARETLRVERVVAKGGGVEHGVAQDGFDSRVSNEGRAPSSSSIVRVVVEGGERRRCRDGGGDGGIAGQAFRSRGDRDVGTVRRAAAHLRGRRRHPSAAFKNCATRQPRRTNLTNLTNLAADDDHRVPDTARDARRDGLPRQRRGHRQHAHPRRRVPARDGEGRRDKVRVIGFVAARVFAVFAG